MVSGSRLTSQLTSSRMSCRTASSDFDRLIFSWVGVPGLVSQSFR